MDSDYWVSGIPFVVGGCVCVFMSNCSSPVSSSDDGLAAFLFPVFRFDVYSVLYRFLGHVSTHIHLFASILSSLSQSGALFR